MTVRMMQEETPHLMSTHRQKKVTNAMKNLCRCGSADGSQLPLSKKALDIKLQEAKASEETDRVKILNAIAGGKPTDGVPCHANHSKYDELNASLRGRLAAGSLRGILDYDRVEVFEQAAKLLKPSGMRKLELSFKDCSKFDAARANTLFGNLPEALEVLDMRYGGLTTHHAPSLGNAIATLKNLHTLKCALKAFPQTSWHASPTQSVSSR